jgi:hypothetical protein
MKEEECPTPIKQKFLALVKVEGTKEPIRYEEYAFNLEECKAMIAKDHKSFTFLTLQEDV